MLFSILFRSFTLYFLFPFFCSQEVLLILEERLGELEQEKQEFAEYEQLERQRRALEYSSYHLEFQKVRCLL